MLELEGSVWDVESDEEVVFCLVFFFLLILLLYFSFLNLIYNLVSSFEDLFFLKLIILVYKQKIVWKGCNI